MKSLELCLLYGQKDDRGSVYAKISSGKQFTMIPIDVSNTIDALGSPIVRVGHGQQTYTSPMVLNGR